MNWLLLKNSLLVSSLATLLAAGFGLMAALWLAGLPTRWRNLFLALAGVALALPPFLVTNCWLDLLGHTRGLGPGASVAAAEHFLMGGRGMDSGAAAVADHPCVCSGSVAAARTGATRERYGRDWLGASSWPAHPSSAKCFGSGSGAYVRAGVEQFRCPGHSPDQGLSRRNVGPLQHQLRHVGHAAAKLAAGAAAGAALAAHCAASHSLAAPGAFRRAQAIPAATRTAVVLVLRRRHDYGVGTGGGPAAGPTRPGQTHLD